MNQATFLVITNFEPEFERRFDFEEGSHLQDFPW